MAKKKQEQDADNFEEALAKLETIVRDLEDGKIGLAEAMQHYEQGTTLLKSCYAILDKAERRIELLSGVDAEGNPIVEEFDQQDSGTLEDKAAKRSRRRSDPSQRAKKSGVKSRSDDENSSLF